MKKIVRKTDKEIEADIERESRVTIKVKDSGNYFWVCENCRVAFFDEDIVLKINERGWFCLNELKTIPGKQVCNTKIYGGDEKTFNKYYKILEI